MGVLVYSDGEIVRFDVPVDDSSSVDVLYSLDHLVGDHQHGLEAQLPLTVVEQVFETFAEQVHDHEIVIAFSAVVKNLRDGLADYSAVGVEPQVDLTLVVELLVFGVDIFELNRYFFFSLGVLTEPDLPEGPRAQLPDEFVVLRGYFTFHSYVLFYLF